MTITTTTGSRTYTEADMLAFAVRFEIRGALGARRYYVDGVEVNEHAYNRAFQKAERERAQGKTPTPFPKRSRR